MDLFEFSFGFLAVEGHGSPDVCLLLPEPGGDLVLELPFSMGPDFPFPVPPLLVEPGPDLPLDVPPLALELLPILLDGLGRVESIILQPFDEHFEIVAVVVHFIQGEGQGFVDFLEVALAVLQLGDLHV